MTFSKGKARPYHLSMAVVCTLLASGGFVGAGYVGTSTADAAAALGVQQLNRSSSSATQASPVSFDSLNAPALAGNISFAKTLILAKKPAAPQRFDLTDPNGNTPQLARSVGDMRGDIPEVSAELISEVRKDILAAAFQGLGHPYVWGGTSFEYGWDCSGFVQWAYAQAGVALPRTEQWLPMVQTNNPQPGDIVVQNPDGPNHWSHIGIYIGGGKMISALNPSVGTFIHAPADVSSSSTYFSMPGFASADELAAQKAKNTISAAGSTTKASATPKPATSKPSATSSAKPSSKPSTGESSDPSTKPPTTVPGTTDPGTKPPVTIPVTTPPVTTPATAPPGTAPATTPPGTAPATTPPGTTTPAITSPITPPVTTPPTTPGPPAATNSDTPKASSSSEATTPLALTTPPVTGSTP
ncbi:C40 family peptidase [Arthrobacter alpinus]|uniref:C40 family peptidase n=1 Tax=Arthrobacter alpinus TaxID=656366 RepID=UPI000A75F1AE|nr:C40 family peptidase [Arthrobacter alpinus]